MKFDAPETLGGPRRQAPPPPNKADVKADAAGRWREIIPAVTGVSSELLTGRQTTCPICGKRKFRTYPDFDQTGGAVCTCGAWADGLALIEQKLSVTFDEAVRLVDEHLRPDGQPSRTQPGATPAPPPTMPERPEPADIAIRNEFYSSLLRELGLSVRHRQDLRARGMTDQQIEHGRYATWGRPTDSLKALKAVQSCGLSVQDLQRIPGMKGLRLDVENCLLIPTIDAEGRIQALHYRKDTGEKKYRWASRRNGVSSGSPAHIAYDPTRPVETLRLTEGPIKANISWHRSGIPTAAVGGVSQWKSFLPFIEALKPSKILLAYDADARENPDVAKALRALYGALVDAGQTVAIETWDSSRKGIDDLLTAGGETEELTGDAAEAYLTGLPTENAAEGTSDAGTQADAPEPAAQGKDKDKPHFRVVTAAELDAGDYETKYLIPGLVAEREPLIIAGQFKALKTTTMLDLAVSLTSMTPFLQRFKVPESRRVLVLTAESGLATVQETCRRIAKGHGTELRALDGLMFCDAVPRLESVAHLTELRKIISDLGVQVLIADPAYLMIDGAEAGNLFAMGDQLKVFSSLAAEAKATPVLLHHAKKTNSNAVEYQPLELADLAWAGFAEFARQWMLLSRRERYTEGTGEHRLWMSVGGSAGHNGCWAVDATEGHPDDDGGRHWAVTVDDATSAKQAASERKKAAKEKAAAEKNEKHAQMLRDAFHGVGHSGQSKSAAFGKAGLNNSNGLAALGVLLRHEVLEPIEVRAGNRSVEGYRLTSRGESLGNQTDQTDQTDNPDNF